MSINDLQMKFLYKIYFYPDVEVQNSKLLCVRSRAKHKKMWSFKCEKMFPGFIL